MNKYNKIFAFYYRNRFGWFRIFGLGLKFKDVTIHGLTFTQRNKFKKRLRIGKWAIGILKPRKK